VQAALQLLGYPPALDVTTEDIVTTFQRRFRPGKVDGVADSETRALLADLLDQVGVEA
jgi:N-acetylmuramoyl-L-alanine amidase